MNFDHGQAVEYILFATGHRSAARLAIAGSAWGFDIGQAGAQLNAFAHYRCFRRNGTPRGLRGALAWQPLFLLSGNSYWSRWKVLRSMKFKSYRIFGSWKPLISPDRLHKTSTQLARADRKNIGLLIGENRSPAHKLRRSIVNSNLRHVDLAREAQISAAAVSRFVNHLYGSEELQQKLVDALLKFTSDATNLAQFSKTRFSDADSVKAWLKTIGRNQTWLALQLDCHRSAVTHLLRGRKRWSQDISRSIEAVAHRLEAIGP